MVMYTDQRNSAWTPVVLGAFLALIFSMTFFSPLFRLRTLEVNTNEFTTREELMTAGHLIFGKTNLPLLSEKGLEKKLMNHPYVKAVSIEKSYPSTLKLTIDYRVDSFAIPNAGYYILLDNELKVLRVDQMAYNATILEGITFKEFNIGEGISADQPYVLQRIVDLNNLMTNSHISFVKAISYDGKRILVKTKAGIEGDFGDGKNIAQRFNHFAEIFDNIQSKGISTGLIDVSSDGLPTYKPFGK